MFFCVLNIFSCPGPVLCLVLSPGCWTVIVSCHVSSRIRTLYPGNKIWNAASTSIGSLISARPFPHVHVWYGVNAKKSERRTETRNGRRRKGSDWRMTFVSWGKQRCSVRNNSEREPNLSLRSFMCLFLRNFSVIILRGCQIIQSLLMPKIHRKE